jgi:hypothetical protein
VSGPGLFPVMGKKQVYNLLYWAMIKQVKSALIILTGLVTIQLQGFTQFNDSVHCYVNYSGTGNINRTSTGATYLLSNALQFQVNKKKVSLNSSVNHVYGSDPVAKTNDDLLAMLNLDLLKGVQKFYYWALAGYEKSFSLKVKNRLQAGGGVGYVFIDSPKANLELSDGILFETTDLDIPDENGKISYQTARNSLRLKYRFLITKIFRFDGVNFYQPALTDGKDYILKLTTNFSIRLYKGLNLTASFNYNRQNITATENLLLTYGLAYEKYF